MAKTELLPELQRSAREPGPVELVIGVTGSPEMDVLRAKAPACLQGIGAKTIVAYAGDNRMNGYGSSEDNIHFASYAMPHAAGSSAFWIEIGAAQRAVLALAGAWQARACLVIHSDLAALDPDTIRLLTEPVLSGSSDLMMPVYQTGKYDALINKSLLSPFSRALYGRRVKFPLAFDFCAGASALAKLNQSDLKSANNGEPQLLWPVNAVATSGGQIGQAAVGTRHGAQTDSMDLSAVLTELAAALFKEAEACAPFWQRVRGSQPALRYGTSMVPTEDAQPIDCRPMVESFVLGSRNLEEVWRLVLPPATMLELKRLARLDVESFRMPDALWARIVYDFALAFRMRRLSRSHLLGALTPLYLGWVASYAQEVGGATTQEANHKVEELARTYEEQKPYLVSRWRWPLRVS
ncbi:MAG TPA: hypothetical protein VFW25_05495 [Silvibacterium sp.]|nr:hypothetical protein [Silvibacterium sp.]